MINNVAYIVNEICSITGAPPVKKALQKTVYLLQEKGVDLGFNYILHFYGPYCAELDHETARLSADGIIEFDYRGYGHKMSVSSAYSTAIKSSLPEPSLHTMWEVIDRYKEESPSDLELLTTAIYAYRHTNARTQSEVTKNVKMIKGEKYNDREIKWALGEFPYFDIHIS